MNKIYVEVTLSRTRKPLSYPCYIRGKGKFYKSTEIKLTENFVTHAFALDRGIIPSNEEAHEW